MVEAHRLPALAQDACTYAVMRPPTAEPLHGRRLRTGGDEYRLQKPWSELVSWAREELSLRPLPCQIQRATTGLYVGGLESENDHQKTAGEHSLEQLRSHESSCFCAATLVTT
jgi:hypothetical protein